MGSQDDDSDGDDSTYNSPCPRVIRDIEDSLTSGRNARSMDEFDEIDNMISPVQLSATRPSTANTAALLMVNNAGIKLPLDDEDEDGGGKDHRGANSTTMRRRRKHNDPLRTNSEHRSSMIGKKKGINNRTKSIEDKPAVRFDDRDDGGRLGESSGGLHPTSHPISPPRSQQRLVVGSPRRYSTGADNVSPRLAGKSSKPTRAATTTSAGMVGCREHRQGRQQPKRTYRHSTMGNSSYHGSITAAASSLDAFGSGHSYNKSSMFASSSLFGAELNFDNLEIHGRDTEIQKLDELLLETTSIPYRRRKRAIVAISGKAGVGKTFLIQSRIDSWTSSSWSKKHMSTNAAKTMSPTTSSITGGGEGDSSGGARDENENSPSPSRATADRCLFASGRFSLHASSAAPLSAITDAVTELVQLWLDATTSSSQSTGSKFKEIAQLVAFLKGNEKNLRDVIPQIYEMVGVASSSTTETKSTASGTSGNDNDENGMNNNQDEDLDDATRSTSNDLAINALRANIFRADRILLDGSGHVVKMALGRLLSFLCRKPDRPVVLFFDAVQRADVASLDLIKFLATAKQANNLQSLLVVVCFRDEEVYPPVNNSDPAQDSQQHEIPENDTDDQAPQAHPIASIVRQHPHYQKQQLQQQTDDDGRHPVAVMLQDIQEHYDRDPEGGGCVLHRLSIDELGVDAVNKIVSYVIDRDEDETLPLSEVVYQKTRGNPFYVLQFLRLLQHEELLKYSYTDFHWEWADVQRIQNATMLSENVADIVAKSILRLPKDTQQTLMVASCLGEVVPVSVIQEFFAKQQEKAAEQKESDEGGGLGLTSPSSLGSSLPALSPTSSASSSSHYYDTYFLVNEARVVKCLKVAARAGILTHSRKTSVYQWSHDKVQHSANCLVPEAVRGSLHLGLGQILWQMGMENPDQEWMVYMAADQINKGSLAAQEVGAINDIELARLNLQAAQLSISKSAFFPATEMLRKGVNHLLKEIASTKTSSVAVTPNPSPFKASSKRRKPRSMSHDSRQEEDLSSPWTGSYALCLDLFNLSAEMEFSLGRHEAALNSVSQVLNNARSREDKFRAQSVLLQCVTSGRSRDYGRGVELSIEILQSYGESVPLKPTAYQMFRQRKKVQRLIPKGRIEGLLDLPDMVDQQNLCKCRLLAGHLARYAHFRSPESSLPCYVSRRVLQLSVRFGITPDTCLALLFVANWFKEGGDPKLACDNAELAMKLMKRFEEAPGSIHSKLKTRVYAAILPTLRPFHQSLDELLDAYRIGLRTGDMEGSSMGAMCYAMCYICTGLKLTPLESDVHSFGQEAQQFGRPLSFVAVFHIIRQTVLNLQTYNKTGPTVFSGEALNQEAMLGQLEGLAKKMTVRDICTFRLMLACIYGDLDAMEELVDVAMSFPRADVLEIRGHLRRTYTAIAAVILGHERGHKKMAKLGKKLTKEFKHEVKNGSVNSYPIWLMLVALGKPSKSRYDECIKICARSGLKHHEAVITEHCARYFMNDGKDPEWAQFYLRKAVSLWEAYGAPGKVQQMSEMYDIVGSSEAQFGSDFSGRTRHVKGLAEKMQTFRILSNRALVPAMDDISEE